MSWSVQLIAKPQKVVEALDAQSEKEQGQCKLEFDAALPHLKALVLENFNDSPGNEPVIHLVASGSGCVWNGKETQRSCGVKIEPVYGVLV